MKKMVGLPILLAAMVACSSCGTVPIDPATPSWTMTVRIPETSLQTDNEGVPTGGTVPFDEDVVLVELKEQVQQADDSWVDTGRVFSLVVEDPIANQPVALETEPQTWPLDTPIRWMGRVIDGWRDPDTNDFLRVMFQTYLYPWSEASWDYERKSTVVNRTEEPVH